MAHSSRSIVRLLILTMLVLLLFVLNLMVGSVRIPFIEVWQILLGKESDHAAWEYIVLQSRFPQAITALFGGGALALSGLMLQTAFRNPLAGPSVFGINSGAGLGVALVMLAPELTLFGCSLGMLEQLLAAFVGAMAVMGIIFAFSHLVRNNVMLLIVGIMIGYMANSAISLLNYFATEEGVKSYMVWGMGNFGGVSLHQVPLYASVSMIGIVGSFLLVKPLNALLLGEQYAENLGVNIVRTRNWLLVTTGLLTAIVTAFCGPIAFIGLAVPHMARLVLGESNHQILMPATLLMGSIVALFCNLVCVLPGESGIIPLNAVTPLIGAPIIIYVILKHQR